MNNHAPDLKLIVSANLEDGIIRVCGFKFDITISKTPSLIFILFITHSISFRIQKNEDPLLILFGGLPSFHGFFNNRFYIHPEFKTVIIDNIRNLFNMFAAHTPES